MVFGLPNSGVFTIWTVPQTSSTQTLHVCDSTFTRFNPLSTSRLSSFVLHVLFSSFVVLGVRRSAPVCWMHTILWPRNSLNRCSPWGASCGNISGVLGRVQKPNICGLGFLWLLWGVGQAVTQHGKHVENPARCYIECVSELELIIGMCIKMLYTQQS